MRCAWLPQNGTTMVIAGMLHKRYVHDLRVISKMWCYECLREMIPHVYTVLFDVGGTTGRDCVAARYENCTENK